MSVYLQTLVDMPLVPYMSKEIRPISGLVRQGLLRQCTAAAKEVRAALEGAAKQSADENEDSTAKVIEKAKMAAQAVPSMVHELSCFQSMFNCAEGAALVSSVRQASVQNDL